MSIINSKSDTKHLLFFALASFAPLYLPHMLLGIYEHAKDTWIWAIIWAQKDEKTALIFTGISALVASLIAFSGVFIPQAAKYIRNKMRLRRKWQGQLRSVMHFIHISSENLSAAKNAIIEGNVHNVRAIRNLLSFKGEASPLLTNCSAQNAPYAFNAEDLANMQEVALNAYLNYEYRTHVLALVYKFLDERASTSAEPDVLENNLREDLFKNIQRVIDAGKTFNLLADPSHAKKIYA